MNAMIHTRIYTASVNCLKDPVLYRRALSLLPEQRRESAERMKIGSGKWLSAGAGLLLMAALADQAAGAGHNRADQAAGYRRNIAEYTSLTIAKGEHGKPYLPDDPQIHFNLSHSGNRVLCMISPVACGCDIEQTDRTPKQIGMVSRCLAESEQRLAAASPVLFSRIWTLKESILKLSGKGLLIPMNSFEVSLDPPAVRQDFIEGPVVLKEYETFRPAEPGTAGYCCACALAGEEAPEEMTQVDLSALLS